VLCADEKSRDVHQANLCDRVEAKTGREPFDRLVADVMSVEPYAAERTVFWIVDKDPSHAGQASIDRLEGAYANLRLIHLPIHASWPGREDVAALVAVRPG